MAKGQKAFQNQQQQYAQQAATNSQAANDRLTQGTPEEQARRARVATRRKAIDSKKFGELPDFVPTFGAPAERQRRREALTSLTPTGATAMGFANANPTALAQMKMNMQDEFDRDAGLAYEQDVKNYIQDTDDMEMGIIRQRTDVDNSLLNSNNSRLMGHSQLQGQMASQRGSWLPSLIGGGLGAVGSIFAGAA